MANEQTTLDENNFPTESLTENVYAEIAEKFMARLEKEFPDEAAELRKKMENRSTNGKEIVARKIKKPGHTIQIQKKRTPEDYCKEDGEIDY